MSTGQLLHQPFNWMPTGVSQFINKWLDGRTTELNRLLRLTVATSILHHSWYYSISLHFATDISMSGSSCKADRHAHSTVHALMAAFNRLFALRLQRNSVTVNVTVGPLTAADSSNHNAQCKRIAGHRDYNGKQE